MEQSFIVRGIAIVIIIGLLILGAWGIVVVATHVPNFVGQFTNRAMTTTSTTSLPAPMAQAPEIIAVTAPTSTLVSGVPFIVSWNYTGDTAGHAYAFTLSYSCGPSNAVSLDAPLPTGEYHAVPCDTPFNYTNADKQMTLVPHVAASATGGASTEITVAAVNLSTGTTSAEGSAVIQFAPAHTSVGASPTTVSKGNSANVAVKGHAVVATPADLAVEIVSARPGSVQFRIMNVGGATARAGWQFTALLPASPAYTYTSAPQAALAPGGSILNTLNWTTPSYYYPPACPMYQYQTYPYTYPQNCYSGYEYGYGGGGAIQIVVDPYGVIWDGNRYNNTASATVY